MIEIEKIGKNGHEPNENRGKETETLQLVLHLVMMRKGKQKVT